jgi:hypothetical protein
MDMGNPDPPESVTMGDLPEAVTMSTSSSGSEDAALDVVAVAATIYPYARRFANSPNMGLTLWPCLKLKHWVFGLALNMIASSRLLNCRLSRTKLVPHDPEVFCGVLTTARCTESVTNASEQVSLSQT